MPDTKVYASPMISSNGHLACPRCFSDYLRQLGVTVFNRQEDIDAPGVLISPAGKVTRSDADNPSARRDAVLIDFDCESCCASLQLCTVQHKGNTHLYWRDMPQ